jgi:hypothetical protein
MFNMDIEIEIIYLNNIEKIIKFACESDYRFQKRIELIKKMEKENIKWKDALKYSKMWYNITYNNAKYDNIPKILKN